MGIRRKLAIVVLTALSVILGSNPGLRAGSFFGPTCYGARYAARYPNRSHNVFGSAAGLPDRIWHPFWNYWYNKYRVQLASCNGAGVANAPATASPTATTVEPPQTVPASR